MRLLYLHGAGGFVDDRALAEGLGAAFDATVDMPRLPDEDMSFEAWAAPVRDHLSRLGGGDLVIGHSFGASILLRVLADRASEDTSNVDGLPVALLAMPDWGVAGWDVAEYAFDGPEPRVPLSLHHCCDDDVVPFAHLQLHAERLPSARVWAYQSGGHQFIGLADRIAADARAKEHQGPPL